MVTLFCALVGVKGNAFSIDIDASKSVDHLKKAIRKENEDITCAARKLELFLARKGDEWLPDDDDAALQLEDGDIHEDIQAMIDGEKNKPKKTKVKPSWTIQEWLDENKMTGERAPKLSRQIHVLVVVPPHDGLRSPAMTLDARKKQKTEVGVHQLAQLVAMAAQLRGAKAEGLLVTPNFTFETWMPVGMYIRQEYLTLRDIIMEQLKANHRVLVLGSPGIGKSVFGVFMLLQFMIEEKDVAYRPLGEQMTYYFTWNGTNYEFSETPRAGKSYAGFFDGSEASGALVLHSFDHVFLFASPRTRNYNQFVKDTCFKVYMNPWTKDECQRFVDAVEKANRAVFEDEWFLRFNLVGGKPRYLFSSKTFASLEAEVERAVPSDLATLKKRVRRSDKHIFDDKAMHMVLSLYRSDGDPSLAYLAYSSLVVEAMLSARYNVESVDEIRSLLQTPALDLQSWRGRELEKLLLQDLATKKLCVRALEGEDLAETHIGPFHAKSEKIQASSAIESELMLYLPLSKTFPAIDGVLVLPAACTIIYAQATVATLHPVKYQPLKDVYQHLTQRQEFHGYTHILLFIVSSDIYDNFAYQPYKNVNGTDRSARLDIAVTQYVGKTFEKKTTTAKTAATDTGPGKQTKPSEPGPQLSLAQQRHGQNVRRK